MGVLEQATEDVHRHRAVGARADGWMPRPASAGSTAGSSGGPGEAIRTGVDHRLGRCSFAAGASFLTGSRAALTECPNGEFQGNRG